MTDDRLDSVVLIIAVVSPAEVYSDSRSRQALGEPEIVTASNNSLFTSDAALSS